jgi:hypothetical protein
MKIKIYQNSKIKLSVMIERQPLRYVQVYADMAPNMCSARKSAHVYVVGNLERVI